MGAKAPNIFFIQLLHQVPVLHQQLNLLYLQYRKINELIQQEYLQLLVDYLLTDDV